MNMFDFRFLPWLLLYSLYWFQYSLDFLLKAHLLALQTREKANCMQSILSTKMDCSVRKQSKFWTGDIWSHLQKHFEEWFLTWKKKYLRVCLPKICWMLQLRAPSGICLAPSHFQSASSSLTWGSQRLLQMICREVGHLSAMSLRQWKSDLCWSKWKVVKSSMIVCFIPFVGVSFFVSLHCIEDWCSPHAWSVSSASSKILLSFGNSMFIVRFFDNEKC